MFYGSYGGKPCPTHRQLLPHPAATLAPPCRDVGQIVPHPIPTPEGSNPNAMTEAQDLNTLCHRVTSLTLLPAVAQAETGKTDAEGRRIYWTLAYDATSTDLHGTRMTPDAFQGSAEALDFPVILFHNKSSFPVAKPVAVEYDERGLNVGFVFASTPEARIAEELVAGGFLRGVSVGFIPRDGYIDEEDGATVFTRADLIELSLTPTPSSRKALIDLTRSLGEDPEELAIFIEGLTEEMDAPETEDRPKTLVPPAYMAESAARGIELYEEGLGGEGLVEDTITEARQMAAGEELSPDKWERIGPWIARHIVDLEGIEEGEITPGVVAMLLWGGGSTIASAERAMEYAKSVVEALPEWHPDYVDEEEASAPVEEQEVEYDQHAHALDLLRALGVEESLLSLITKPGTKTLADEELEEKAAEETTEETTSKQAATLDSARERAHRNLALIRRHRLR